MAGNKDPADLVIKPGDVYGRLTILERIPKTDNVRCRCSCGTEFILRHAHACLRGASPQKSCGCLKEEGLKYKSLHIGDRFGMLTLVEEVWRTGHYSASPTGVKRKRYWRCLCDCGTEYTTLVFRLTSGEARSCLDCTPRKQTARIRKMGGTVFKNAPRKRPSPRIVRVTCNGE